MSPRTLFEKFGHRCEIGTGMGELHAAKSTKVTCITKLRRYLQQMYKINETNKRTYTFLRSQKKLAREHKKQMQHAFVIHPFSDFRKYWEMIMIIVLLMQFFMAPLNMAAHELLFKHMLTQSSLFAAARITTSMLSSVDIILHFLSGYCEEKSVQLKPSLIARHYLRSTFILDLLCSIPIDVVEQTIFKLNAGSINLNRLIRLGFLVLDTFIKISRFFLFIRYSRNVFESSELSFIFYQLWIATNGFLLYLHVFTCMGITGNWIEHPHNIKTNDDFYSSYGHGIETLIHFYIRFFYYTCHFILNSFFFMKPNTGGNVLSCIMVWIISKILSILVIVYFMELHSAVRSSAQKFSEVIDGVKDYMEHRQIPMFLQTRVLAFYDIKFQNYYFQESEILETVSGQLRQEITMNKCKKLVETVTYFRNLPLALLVRIVSCLRFELYLTNDVIIKFGSTGNSMYFILTGTVGVYTKTGKEICHLQDGDHFGEIALVMKESKRIASIIAAEVCELYRLDRKDFVRAIMPYPDLFDKIVYLAGQRMERTDIITETAEYKKRRRKSPFSSK